MTEQYSATLEQTPDEWFIELDQGLELIEQHEKAGGQVPEEVTAEFLDLAERVTPETEVISQGFTIPGTDEWIPGKTKVLYNISLHNADGSTTTERMDPNLAVRLLAFADSHKPVADTTGSDTSAEMGEDVTTKEQLDYIDALYDVWNSPSFEELDEAYIFTHDLTPQTDGNYYNEDGTIIDPDLVQRARDLTEPETWLMEASEIREVNLAIEAATADDLNETGKDEFEAFKEFQRNKMGVNDATFADFITTLQNWQALHKELTELQKQAEAEVAAEEAARAAKAKQKSEKYEWKTRTAAEMKEIVGEHDEDFKRQLLIEELNDLGIKPTQAVIDSYLPKPDVPDAADTTTTKRRLFKRRTARTTPETGRTALRARMSQALGNMFVQSPDEAEQVGVPTDDDDEDEASRPTTTRRSRMPKRRTRRH